MYEGLAGMTGTAVTEAEGIPQDLQIGCCGNSNPPVNDKERFIGCNL